MLNKKSVPRLSVIFSLFAGILLSAASSAVLAQTGGTCAENAAALKKEFTTLQNARKSSPGSVTDEDFRASAKRYIDAAEVCYIQKYGVLDGPNAIDNGALYMPSPSPSSEASEPGFAEYLLWGRKWGAGSSFAGGQDVAGPRISGGQVTWSLMPDGVSMAGEQGAGNNVAIESLPTYSACFLNEIQVAFNAWAAAADIAFVFVTDDGANFNAAGTIGDIRVGAHTIDGPSGALAHAFAPPPNGTTSAGDIHFDITENWRCDAGPGQLDIGIVMAHEIGHSIGLEHEVTGRTALMNQFYNPTLSGPIADDILGAENIYGAPSIVAAFDLFFDWTRTGNFGTTTIDYFNNLTFVTGDGRSGNWECRENCQSIAFTFNDGGCNAMYAGQFNGFMNCTDGSTNGTPPAWYFLEPPVSAIQGEPVNSQVLDSSGEPK